MLVLLSTVVHRLVERYDYASLVLGCAFDSVLVHLAYRRSAKVNWTSVSGFPCWFAYTFAEGVVYALVEAVVSSRKGDTSGVLGVDKVFHAREVVWSVASADLCSMADAVDHIRPSQCSDPEVFGLPSASPAVVDAHDAELDPGGDCDSSDIPPFGEINVCRSLQADFTVIRDKCIEYSVEARKTAPGVFKLALRRLNSLREQRGLFASVKEEHSPIESVAVEIQSLHVKYHRTLQS